jgi:alcohol dehydrogenase, propanol-preferring
MNNTYKAVQVTKPGHIELVERKIVEPGFGQVRIHVEACGICHTDATTIEGMFPGLEFPRVPGHEVVGRIEAIGEGVTTWKVGQRVGVGFLGGHCGVCRPCRKGDFVNCQNQPLSGITHDGGYAETMIARASGLAGIPDELNSADAAPLICAGITTFNALRKTGARPGDVVAIHGIGGLGHLGVQFARSMGFNVVAIARGREKAALAKELGAHHYIDMKSEDAVQALQKLGGAQAIVSTVTDSASMSSLIPGLAPNGKFLVAGAPAEPLSISPSHLLFGTRVIQGTLTGSSMDNEDTLTFSALEKIRPTIETLPLEKAQEAYNRMMQGKAVFRMVLVMN